MSYFGVRSVVCVVVLAVCLVLPGVASADRVFSSRFSTNAQGDITIAANSLESCLDALAVCDDVRDGTGPGPNNNDRTVTWIDRDAEPETFDSSSADLTLPTGATVLFAGLYYGGRLAAGTGGSPAPNPAARNMVLLKAPGDSGYRSLTASQVDTASTQYQGFVNVTPIVAAAGAGSYWTANVQLGTGLSDSGSGGWALVVAYGDPAAASRNLSVFDGLQSVGSSASVTIPLSGFQTPLSGPVTSTVGLVAFEGDLGTLGDGAAIRGGSGAFTALSNAVNPGPPATSASNSNVFNSTISNAGELVTSRMPSYRNNLGYDADLFRTTNLLGNAQTSTQVRLSTSGDAYQPGVVTLATDLYAPRITATKTVDAATANLGDTLTYTVAVQNTGQDGATGTTFSDALAAGTVFVPGSIRVNGAAVSDAAGDDLGEFAGGRVVARLGTGATAAVGGTLAPNASATVSFQVTVATAGLALGATIDNAADFSFQAATTGVPSTVRTAPASTRVLVPDLAIGKSHSPALSPGVPSTYTIAVSNVGDGPTAGTVTVTDTIEPPGLTINGPVTGAGWACSTSGSTVTCTRSDALAAGSDYPPISIPVLVSPSAPPSQLSNTTTLQAPSDGNPDNNAFTDAGAVSEPAIDLHVEKVVTSTPNFTPIGYLHFLDPITYRITVSNNGVADAANVQLAETFDAPLLLDSLVPSQGSCSGTVCNLGTITPGEAPVTIDVQLSIANSFDTYPSAELLNNTATVSAPVGTEINPDDNSASAAISTVPWAETSITKDFAPAQPVAGGPITYTLTVHSDGPGTVDMVVADILPDALQKPPTAISISGGTGVCRYDPTRENSGFPPGSPIVFCEIPQLGPGEDRVITIRSTLAPDSAGTQVDNLALSSNTLPFAGVFSFEPDFTNNEDLVSFTPGAAPPDLAVRIRPPGRIVREGDTSTWRVIATNEGPTTATGVALTLTPRGGTSRGTRAAPSGCRVGPPRGCMLGTLAPGERRTIQVLLRRWLPGLLRLRARIQGAETETRTDNNIDNARIRVRVGRATVALRKRAAYNRVPPGFAVPFTITVRSVGHRAARSLLVCDRLPPGLSLVRAPGARLRTKTACWRIGRLAAGATRRLKITARAVGAAAGQRVVNRATVAGANIRARTASAALRVQAPAPPPPNDPCSVNTSRAETRAAC